jgi:hypothetical protein
MYEEYHDKLIKGNFFSTFEIGNAHKFFQTSLKPLFKELSAIA